MPGATIHDSRIGLFDKVGEIIFSDNGQREIFYPQLNPKKWENAIEDEQDTLYEDNYGYLDIE